MRVDTGVARTAIGSAKKRFIIVAALLASATTPSYAAADIQAGATFRVQLALTRLANNVSEPIAGTLVVREQSGHVAERRFSIPSGSMGVAPMLEEAFPDCGRVCMESDGRFTFEWRSGRGTLAKGWFSRRLTNLVDPGGYRVVVSSSEPTVSHGFTSNVIFRSYFTLRDKYGSGNRKAIFRIRDDRRGVCVQTGTLHGADALEAGDWDRYPSGPQLPTLRGTVNTRCDIDGDSLIDWIVGDRVVVTIRHALHPDEGTETLDLRFP